VTNPRPKAPRDEPEPVVVRDKRKIDPVTGEARPDRGEAAADPAAAPRSDLEAAVAERTEDLQRLQAEYANYRKRAERDRLAAGDVAVSRVLTELLPVLDDIDRARAHDDLTGGLKAVADHLDAVFAKLGLVGFGDVGDPFDPAIHEAVMHAEGDGVTEPTCTTVMRRGYRHGERLLRPAMVGVTEPATPQPQQQAQAQPDEEGQANPADAENRTRPPADPPRRPQGDPADDTA
jgi:molecular chaperone GrpE